MQKILLVVAVMLSALSANAQQWDNYKSNLVDQSVKINGGGLPIVFINTKNTEIQKDSYILAYMKIIDNGEGNLNYSDTVRHKDQTVDYEGHVAIKYRGNSSFSASNKKPFAITTLKSDTLPDNGGSKDKVKILGMKKDNKWVMLAPWCDKTMIRDALAFDLGRQWFDYTPHTRFCEVILDGTYYGVYIFTEKVSQGKKRLDLHDPGADGDTTGDYLVKVDRQDWSTPYYQSPNRPWGNLSGSSLLSSYTKYEYVYPDEDDFANDSKLKGYINNEIKKMEDAFKSDDYADSLQGYRKYIDVNSFIDYMLSTELAMNIDGYRLSTNMYKYNDTHAAADSLDSRWKMTLWDFNIAYGNANYYNGWYTDKWQYNFNMLEPNESEVLPFYWYKLLNDNAYKKQMAERWVAYRNSNYSDEAMIATIDSLANILVSSGAVDRNQQAWNIIGQQVWPNKYNYYTYDDELQYLKDFITTRASYMDETFEESVNPKDPTTMIPYEVFSGFNEDIIAEASPAASHTTANMDGSYVFYTKDYRESGGLTSQTITADGSGVTYRLADFDENNALVLTHANNEGTLVLKTPTETSAIYLLGTSTCGSASMSVTVNYADGTSSAKKSFSFSDWSVKSPTGTEAISGLGRCGRDGDYVSGSTPHYCMFDAKISTDPKRSIESLTFTNGSDGSYGIVFAVSGYPEETNGIFTVEGEQEAGACKFIQNGKVVISKNGRHYNVAGQALQ